MRPESLIFDIDGTLWDSRSIVAEGYNKYLYSIGHPELAVNVEQLTGLFGKTLEEIADLIFDCFGIPERYQVIRGCMDTEQELLHADPCKIDYPGVVTTLRELAKRYRLFIVSNSEKGYPDVLIQKLDIGDIILDHMCYGDTGLCKGETIKLLMQRNDITSAVYIGDTQGDLEASRLAGIPFVFCRYGFGKPEEYDAAIDSFPELLELF